MKKVDEFKILLLEEDYDIVFVTESWTQAHIGDAEINVEGYDLFRKDRKTSRGGGCIIYTKKHLKITLIEDLTFNFESESVWCMCKTCDYELAIGVCYRNPSACDIEEENLHECIRVACDRYKNIIIAGDFNHPTIKWDELHTRKEGQNFLNLTLDCFLTQHVTEQTRGRNIFDLVMSKPEQLIEEVKITLPLETSDHDSVEFIVPVRTNEDNWKIEYLNYRKANFKGIRKYLKIIDWVEVFNNLECEEMWNVFKGIYDDVISEFVPKQTRRKTKRQPPLVEQKATQVEKKD